MTDKNERRLRDFIYLDVDRLYSLYSQVFEGVADQIIQSYADALATERAQKGAPLSGTSMESTTLEISRRTENKILHDHMYTLLEGQLKSAIVDTALLPPEQALMLTTGTYVRAAGPVRISDFARMKVLFKDFNKLAEVIAYSLVMSISKDDLSAAENAVREINDRNQRAVAKAKLDKMKDPKQVARDMGMLQDEQLLKNLAFFTDMFYPDGFDITVFSTDATVGYRAVIDERWLRVAAGLLRFQYGGSSIGPWILVGQITHVPGTSPSFPVPSTDPALPGGDETPSMRDPYMSMFQAALGFERAFLESKTRTEIVINPLAIYREVILQLAE